MKNEKDGFDMKLTMKRKKEEYGQSDQSDQTKWSKWSLVSYVKNGKKYDQRNQSIGKRSMNLKENLIKIVHFVMFGWVMKLLEAL